MVLKVGEYVKYIGEGNAFFLKDDFKYKLEF